MTLGMIRLRIRTFSTLAYCMKALIITALNATITQYAGTQNNNTQHDDIQNNDTQLKETEHDNTENNDTQHDGIHYNDTQH